jgi:endoglucanase
MDSAALLSIIRSVLAQPTAPFHEDAVRAEITMQLAQLPHVNTDQDDFGNVIACYRGCSDHAEYAFAAHMDHPGYVGDEFLGGVPEAHRANGRTRDFGAFSMWDLPACEVRDGLIYSRACDDLIGCSAIVALFHELERLGAEATVYGLFTRAEEVGFVGAIQLARSRRVSQELTIVSLETSSDKAPGCKMGAGPIVRVGDRASIFDDAATANFAQLATGAKLPFQRCLMSGGTCEATAYQLYGYRTAALCVALGNYHNCAPDEQIDAEYVALADVAGMVELMRLASMNEQPADVRRALRERLEKAAAKYEHLF